MVHNPIVRLRCHCLWGNGRRFLLPVPWQILHYNHPYYWCATPQTLAVCSFPVTSQWTKPRLSAPAFWEDGALHFPKPRMRAGNQHNPHSVAGEEWGGWEEGIQGPRIWGNHSSLHRQLVDTPTCTNINNGDLVWGIGCTGCLCIAQLGSIATYQVMITAFIPANFCLLLGGCPSVPT